MRITVAIAALIVAFGLGFGAAHYPVIEQAVAAGTPLCGPGQTIGLDYKCYRGCRLVGGHHRPPPVPIKPY